MLVKTKSHIAKAMVADNNKKPLALAASKAKVTSKSMSKSKSKTNKSGSKNEDDDENDEMAGSRAFDEVEAHEAAE